MPTNTNAIAWSSSPDAKEFLTSADWYTTLGIPYRRAYLFHGKPGNNHSLSFTIIVITTIAIEASILLNTA